LVVGSSFDGKLFVAGRFSVFSWKMGASESVLLKKEPSLLLVSMAVPGGIRDVLQSWLPWAQLAFGFARLAI